MTVLTGSLVQSPIGRVETPTISANLRAYDVDYWPPHAAAVGGAPEGIVASALPVAANGRALSGDVLRSYVLDFYDRIHLDPLSIDLGNLVTSQTRTVTVWNAWRSRAVSMTALQTVAADGITATGEGALPLAFAPLQQRIWSIAITPDGPATIAATLTWVFAGDPSVSLAITGNRLTAWTIPPDWSNGVLERLEWLTEVQQASSGSQDAYPLRDAPRRTWEFDVRVADADRRLLDAALYDWAARNWAFPVMPDHSLLMTAVAAGAVSIPLDTAYLDYVVGGLAMLWSSPAQYELVEIAAIAANALTLARATTSAWPAGTRMYPVRITRLADRPQLQHATDRRADAHARMESVEPCDWPAVAPAAVYAGYPVLEHRCEVSTAPTAIYERQIDVLDADIGPVHVDDVTGLAWGRRSHAWTLFGRADRAAHRSLLYWLQGRASRLWVPSGMDDLMLAAPAGAASTTLVVDWCGYTRFAHAQPGRQHLRIELVGGAVLYRKVLSSAELDSATEQLGLDAALGMDIAPAQVASISYMALCTLAGDAAEILHDTDSEGVAHSRLEFAQVPGNE